jgi:hypothetical protein
MKRLLAAACAAAATVFASGSWSAAPPRAVAATANVTVVQQGFIVVGDASWRVVVDIEGADSDKLNIDVVSHRRVDTRAELADALAGRLPEQLDRLRFSLADVPRNDAGRRILNVPTVANTSAPENLLFGSTGVYPVVIELRAGEGLLGSTTTFIHRLDTDDAVSAGIDGALRVMNVAA